MAAAALPLAQTHHIVQLDAILEAQLLELLLRCRAGAKGASGAWLAASKGGSMPCRALTVGLAQSFEQLVAVDSHHRHPASPCSGCLRSTCSGGFESRCTRWGRAINTWAIKLSSAA